MEPTYTWSEIEKAIEKHGQHLLKQSDKEPTPMKDGVPDLSAKAALASRINMATKSIKESIKHFLDNPEEKV